MEGGRQRLICIDRGRSLSILRKLNFLGFGLALPPGETDDVTGGGPAKVCPTRS